MGDYIILAISCVLINNILLAQYLGNCPFLGTSKKMETATGMAMAVVFVLVLAGVITWMVDNFILQKFGLVYLRTIAFILVIASLVQMVELILKKVSPPLYQALGVFLPLITTNCAILGVALLLAMTLAPITWVVLSEIFPNKIRGAAMAVATTALWIGSFLLVILLALGLRGPMVMDQVELNTFADVHMMHTGNIREI